MHFGVILHQGLSFLGKISKIEILRQFCVKRVATKIKKFCDKKFSDIIKIISNMDDFDLDVYEKCIDVKNSSAARLGRQLLKENNQHERIMKIMNMTRYCLYQKIRKLENLLYKYESKKVKKAKKIYY
jgi:hypothetical protein